MTKIPNFQKLLAKSESFRVGAVRSTIARKRVWVKKLDRQQETIPNDPDVLKKLGLKKNKQIVFVAGYYGDWANALATAGCRVTYSELSRSIVDFARKKFRDNKNILKFSCANFLHIPKKANQFDWTVSFEPTSITIGLPIAITRGLMNQQGIKIIHYPRPSLPEGKYDDLTKIAQMYDCQFSKKLVAIRSVRHDQSPIDLNHLIYTLTTNDHARQKALEDIRGLENGKYSKESLVRLAKLAKLIKSEYQITSSH